MWAAAVGGRRRGDALQCLWTAALLARAATAATPAPQACNVKSCTSTACYVNGVPTPIISSPPYAGQTDVVQGCKVLIRSNLFAGDVLSLPASTQAAHGVATTWDAVQGVLTVSGAKTVEEYGVVLALVELTSFDTRGLNKTISWNLGTSVFDSDNGHFYEYKAQTGITWQDANTACQSISLFGYTGYLVTITSAAEQAFATEKLTGSGWIGASDQASEGQWRWVTGCEQDADGGLGQLFWVGTGTGAAQGGAYSNWDPGEPNDAAGEDFGHLWGSAAQSGRWNDFSNTNPRIEGYVCEWGGNCPSAGTPSLPPAGIVVVEACPPTLGPTVAPSSARPTAGPSEGPTVSPTAASPSAAPTASPSVPPTALPSSRPSAAPSPAPSASPSAAPTTAPSQAPSAPPTAAPSGGPTVEPTGSPTTEPSAAPSQGPSASPSLAPTPHACDDGSHSCGNTSAGVRCSRMPGTAAFVCSCSDTYVCVDNCSGNVDLQCVLLTPAPQDDDLLWPYYLLALALLCCLPCLLLLWAWRRKRRKQLEEQRAKAKGLELDNGAEGTAVWGGAATSRDVDCAPSACCAAASLPPERSATLVLESSGGSGWEYRARLSPPRSAAGLPGEDAGCPPGPRTAAEAALEVERLQREVSELEMSAASLLPSEPQPRPPPPARQPGRAGTPPPVPPAALPSKAPPPGPGPGSGSPKSPPPPRGPGGPRTPPPGEPPPRLPSKQPGRVAVLPVPGKRPAPVPDGPLQGSPKRPGRGERTPPRTRPHSPTLTPPRSLAFSGLPTD